MSRTVPITHWRGSSSLIHLTTERTAPVICRRGSSSHIFPTIQRRRDFDFRSFYNGFGQLVEFSTRENKSISMAIIEKIKGKLHISTLFTFDILNEVIAMNIKEEKLETEKNSTFTYSRGTERFIWAVAKISINLKELINKLSEEFEINQEDEKIKKELKTANEFYNLISRFRTLPK